MELFSLNQELQVLILMLGEVELDTRRFLKVIENKALDFSVKFLSGKKHRDKQGFKFPVQITVYRKQIMTGFPEDAKA